MDLAEEANKWQGRALKYKEQRDQLYKISKKIIQSDNCIDRENLVDDLKKVINNIEQ